MSDNPFAGKKKTDPVAGRAFGLKRSGVANAKDTSPCDDGRQQLLGRSRLVGCDRRHPECGLPPSGGGGGGLGIMLRRVVLHRVVRVTFAIGCGTSRRTRSIEQVDHEVEREA